MQVNRTADLLKLIRIYCVTGFVGGDCPSFTRLDKSGYGTVAVRILRRIIHAGKSDVVFVRRSYFTLYRQSLTVSYICGNAVIHGDLMSRACPFTFRAPVTGAYYSTAVRRNAAGKGTINVKVYPINKVAVGRIFIDFARRRRVVYRCKCKESLCLSRRNRIKIILAQISFTAAFCASVFCV